MGSSSVPRQEADCGRLGEEPYVSVVDFVRSARVTRLRAEAQEAIARMRVARAVLDLRRAGDSVTLDALTRAAGLTAKALAPYALLGRRWASAEFEEFFVAMNSQADSVFVAHFLVLARLPLAVQKDLAERVRSEALTVHELARLVRMRSSPPPAPSPGAPRER